MGALGVGGDDVGHARVDQHLLEPAAGRHDEQDPGDSGQARAERVVDLLRGSCRRRADRHHRDQDADQQGDDGRADDVGDVRAERAVVQVSSPMAPISISSTASTMLISAAKKVGPRALRHRRRDRRPEPVAAVPAGAAVARRSVSLRRPSSRELRRHAPGPAG